MAVLLISEKPSILIKFTESTVFCILYQDLGRIYKNGHRKYSYHFSLVRTDIKWDPQDGRQCTADV